MHLNRKPVEVIFEIMKFCSKSVKISTLLNILTGAVLTCAGIVFIYLVNSNMRQLALQEAESKARLLLNRNLATHHYFSQIMKPALLNWSEPFRSRDYFEPSWMSSTYAVREIDRIFKDINNNEEGDYYYKECAINARSKENEADTYERQFLQELNSNSDLIERSDIRQFENQPYFVLLRKGETLEQSCLLCHSTPDQAPVNLVEFYGSERSFHREVDDVASAISIRVPLAKAYQNADRFSLQLIALLLLILVGIYMVQFWLYRRLLFTPLNNIRQKAIQISTDEDHLGEEIAMPAGYEWGELTRSFNTMSRTLRDHMLNLEETIQKRTSELTDINTSLHSEIAERKRIEEDREELISELRDALSQVKQLSGLLPICSSCKKIRDDQGYWNSLESYFNSHSEVKFTHGICPECAKKLYPDLFEDEDLS